MRKEVMQRVLCVLGGTHKKSQRGKNTQAPISFSFGSPKGMWKRLSKGSGPWVMGTVSPCLSVWTGQTSALTSKAGNHLL